MPNCENARVKSICFHRACSITGWIHIYQITTKHIKTYSCDKWSEIETCGSMNVHDSGTDLIMEVMEDFARVMSPTQRSEALVVLTG